jgi:penicillin-binding protein 2
MKYFDDDTQNLRARLRVIQVIIFVLLSVLIVRLYYLQIVNGERYAERAENQRIRLLRIPAPRGIIFDREERVLVESRPIYNVVMSRDDLRGKDLDQFAQSLSVPLEIDAAILREQFDAVRSQPAFESVRIKENATLADIQWVESHEVEFPELRIEIAPQRRYPENGVLAHVLGYVGEISPRQLEEPEYRDRGLRAGDIIGKEGIEARYDDLLRGRDGFRRVVVDSRGNIQSVLEEVPPQPGQDMVLTIDLDLQLAAEERLRTSPRGRGVIVAMDPNNGEIFALASYPTFDPNLFSQRITTPEGRREYAALLNDPERPLLNRAIRGRYPPGSTWKIPMAIAGLQQGAITLQNSRLVCGGGIQIGTKFTRCMGNHGSPDVRAAIHRSCNGYFYRLGLRMGLDGIRQMVDDFEMNRRTGVDLPGELISQTPSREFKARYNPTNPEWRDIDTVYSSIGQVYDVMTPLAMLRAVASISVGGRLYVPHLLREAREVRAFGTPDHPDYRALRPARGFDRLEPKIISFSAENHRAVMEGTWAVVNAGGTAARIRMAGFDIAGKTGTAQVAEVGQDTGENEDHAWFVSFAPAYSPEIAVIALIENSGFGGVHAAPASRAIYDIYYRKTRGEQPPGDTQLAQRQ